MNVDRAKAAMLAGGLIKGRPAEKVIRQAWRNLTDAERAECEKKLDGDKKDVTSNDSGKVSSSTKRTSGTG